MADSPKHPSDSEKAHDEKVQGEMTGVTDDAGEVSPANSADQDSVLMEEPDEILDRNPEPPPELVKNHLLDADNIGSTVFSRRWVLNTLMRLIQTVDSHTEGKPETDDTVDLDSDLQDELCKLWDMSMNSEVVEFLQEFKTMEILMGVISKSKAPRATEICVGILGNMACNEVVCRQMADDTKFIGLMLALLDSNDTQTLVETTRLVHTCLSSSSACAAPWLTAIGAGEDASASVYSTLVFILRSSTNSQLLQNVGELVDKVLYTDESLCERWSSPAMAQAVLEAYKQARSSGDSADALETFLHVFQLMSTCTAGVKAIVEYGSELLGLTLGFLQSVCEDEVVILSGKENSIGSALSVINVLLPSWRPQNLRILDQDYQLTRCVLKILDAVYPKYCPDTAEQLRLRRTSHDDHDEKQSGIGRRRRRVSETGHSPVHGVNTGLLDSVRGVGDAGSCPTPLNGDDGDHEAWRTPFTRGSVCQSERGDGDGGGSGGGASSSRGSSSSSSTHIISMLYEVLTSCIVEMVLLFPQLSPSQASDYKQSNGDSTTTTPKTEPHQQTLDNGASVQGEDTKTDDSEPHPSSSGESKDSELLNVSVTSSNSDMDHDDAQQQPQPLNSNPYDPKFHKKNMPQTLQYLEKMCLRSRIQYLVNVLKECEAGENTDLLQVFLDTIILFDLERVRRIVRSAL